MPIAVHRRHGISDAVWEKPEPRLPGREGSWGGGARDNRRFVNAVFWVMRAGAPWRDPSLAPGGWSDTRRRFTRWRDNGVWERPPEIPIAGFTLMRRAREEATGTWAAQKGAQHEIASDRGCAWHAGQGFCHTGRGSGLRSGNRSD